MHTLRLRSSSPSPSRRFLLTAAASVLCWHPPPAVLAFVLPALRPRPASSSFTTMTAASSSSSSSTTPSGTSATLLPHLTNFKSKATLILASKSPRRQEILTLMGFGPGEFAVMPSDFPEDLDKEAFANPADYAQKNAELKAYEVAIKLFAAAAAAAEADGGAKKTIIVIGSDTIVDRDGTILEKPDDDAHAHAMLTSLSGRQHLVHSGVAVFSSLGPRSEEYGTPLPVVSFSETARVTFAPLASEEIWSYVRSGEPMDKAGSYGIQGLGGQMVRGIDGCYFTVMGLPMHRLSAALARMVDEGLV